MKDINTKTTASPLSLLAAVTITCLLLSCMGEAEAFTDRYLVAWDEKDTELLQAEDEVHMLQSMLGTNQTLLSAERSALQDRIYALESKMRDITAEMDEIERNGIDSFKVDPQTEARLVAAEAFLHERYLDKESQTYVGKNDIVLVLADFQDERMYVLVGGTDYTQKRGDLIADFLASETGVPVEVEFGEMTEISRKTRTSNFTPLIGGISVATAGKGLDADSTLGFKAVDRRGNTGFVIPSHVGVAGDGIYQAAGSNRQVGTVTESHPRNRCDCAFVSSTTPVSDKIFKNYRQSYTINDYAVQSDLVAGTMLKKSGITTGTTSGTILRDWNGQGPLSVMMHVEGGDGGSPVFKPNGNNAELFGMLVAKYETFVAVEPYPKIQSTLGLR